MSMSPSSTPAVTSAATPAAMSAADVGNDHEKSVPYDGLVFRKYLSPSVLQKMDLVYHDLPQLPNTESARSLAFVDWEELEIQTVLGQGGFAYVLNVKHNPGKSPEASAPSSQQQQSQLQSQLQKREQRQTPSSAHAPLSEKMDAAPTSTHQPAQHHLPQHLLPTVNYACKCLKSKNIKSNRDLIAAAHDLFLEAHWLRQIHHENIIALLGVCAADDVREDSEEAEETPVSSAHSHSLANAQKQQSQHVNNKRYMAKLSQSYVQGAGNGFFLILPKLERTLLEQFRMWKQQEQGFDSYDEDYYCDGYNGISQRLQIYDAYDTSAPTTIAEDANSLGTSPSQQQQQTRSWKFSSILSGMSSSVASTSLLSKRSVHQRLRTIAIPILKAMEYLHSQKHLVYRDLKPENIGFLRRSNRLHVRLLDFGLARTVRQLQDLPEPEIAGSWRYMAPELIRQDDPNMWINMLSEPVADDAIDDVYAQYYCACDIYSFAIVLWELITLNVPFLDCSSPEDFERSVGYRKHRPSLTFVGSKKLQLLLIDCWRENPFRRPSFATVLRRLEHDILRVDKQAAPQHRPFTVTITAPKKHVPKQEASMMQLPEQSDTRPALPPRQSTSSVSSHSRSPNRFMLPRFRSSKSASSSLGDDEV